MFGKPEGAVFLDTHRKSCMFGMFGMFAQNPTHIDVCILTTVIPSVYVFVSAGRLLVHQMFRAHAQRIDACTLFLAFRFREHASAT